MFTSQSDSQYEMAVETPSSIHSLISDYLANIKYCKSERLIVVIGVGDGLLR